MKPEMIKKTTKGEKRN